MPIVLGHKLHKSGLGAPGEFAMSRSLEVQKAQYEFGQFIRELSTFRARSCSPYDLDPPVVPFVDVPKAEALEAFLLLNPELTKFRDALAQVRSGQDRLLFKQNWRELIAISAPA